jgi:hypothetical protein
MWKRLPWYGQCLLLAATGGLVIGVLAGLWSGPQSQLLAGTDWQRQERRVRAAVEPLLEKLDSNDQWSRGAVEAVEAVAQGSEEPTDTGTPMRPGVFRYLQLVAILQEPGQVAVMQVDRIPAEMQALLLIEPDSDGLLQWRTGDLVATGWQVASVTATGLMLSVEDGSEQVDYELFEW